MIIPTGFIDLDSILISPRKKVSCEFGNLTNGGINIPSFIVLGARTAMGKTAFLLNLALNFSFHNQKICFISLDLNAQHIAERFNSIIEENSISDKGFLNSIEIMDEYLRFKELIAFIEEKAKNDGPKIFMIDYIQLFNHAQESLYEESSYICVTLKNLCTRLGICIIAASQLNRAVESRTGHRPRLTDLRDSGAMEESADQILLLYRREYYDPNDKPGQAEIIIAKNRFGEAGSINLTYIRESNTFANFVLISYQFVAFLGDKNHP